MVEQGGRQGAEWASDGEDPTAPIEQKDHAARSPEIKVALADQINFACHQNAVPLVRDLVVANETAQDLCDLTLELTASPGFVSGKTWSIDNLRAGTEIEVRDRDTRLQGQFLLDLTEAMTGSVTLVLRQGEEELARVDHSVEVLARNEWGGYAAMPELVAAFSMPNDPAVDRLLGQAADILRSADRLTAIDGYTSASRKRVWEVAGAIWSAVGATELSYAYPPASFERTGQKVRTPTMVFSSKLATCLDTTLLFCAALEQASLRPVIVLKQGHALVGVWLQPEEFSLVATDDVSAVRKRIDLNELILFETTLIAQAPVLPFSHAVERGRTHVSPEEERDFICAIDIQRARDQRIRPLSFAQGVLDDQAEEADHHVTVLPNLEAPPDLPDFDREDQRAPEEELTPEGRLDRWQRRLLDLTARNPLLNQRMSGQSIPLICPDPGALEDRLADGKQIRIAPLPDLSAGAMRDADIHTQRTGEGIEREFVMSGLERNEVFVRTDAADLDKRLVNLYRKAKSDLEEGGANTLFLALGFLNWRREDRKDKVYRAPLVLVPVELKRKSVRSGPRLVLHDDEPRFNTTLLEMLRQDVGLDIHGLDGALPGDHSGVDVPGIWTQIRREVRDVPGFEVTEDVVLGTFSFAKFLMWKDLVDRTDQLKENPVVRHLIDTPRDPYLSDVAFHDPSDLDTAVSPADLFVPLDADSSQLAAVVASGEGKDFVMIGPPGTGKSQSIANMIAHNMALGKTVLFVSEKQAALNVVYRRLRDVGLGAFCLELHSNKARKVDVLQQFRSAWDTSARMSEQEWTREANRLKALRDDLNRYVERLHEPHPNGMTVHRAVGVAKAGEGLTVITVTFADVDQHTGEDIGALRDIVHRMDLAVADVGGVTDHPLALIHADSWSNAWQQDLVGAAVVLAQAAQTLEQRLGPVCERLQVDLAPLSFDRLAAIAAMARALLGAHGQRVGFALDAQAPAMIDAAGEALDLLAVHRELEGQLSTRYRDQPWRHLDVDVLKAAWSRAVSSWWPKRLFAMASVRKSMRRDGQTAGKPEPVKDLPTLERMRQHGRKIDALSETVAAIPDWAGFQTRPERLKPALDCARTLRVAVHGLADDPDTLIALKAEIRKLVEEGNELLAPDAAVGRVFKAFLGALQDFEQDSEQFSALSGGPVETALRVDENCLGNIQKSCAEISNQQARINRWCAWRRVRAEALDWGLGPFVEAAEQGAITAGQYVETFDANYSRWWAAQKIDQDDVLREFVSSVHEDRIAQFQELDDTVRDLSARHVRARICGQIPDKDDVTRSSDYGLLKRELEKKQRHKPLRQLFTEAPAILSSLTPCVLMSPLSIAQYLPANLDAFDLVIFDEASQITVWDAIGAIARGRQTVVAGDPKQMPPTNFFGRRVDYEEDDSDIEGDLESILDEMLGANIPTRDLAWHYRSRNEGLIAFSNHNYYDGTLITFPAPWTRDRSVQLRTVNGTYMRGQGRVNHEEARAVVAEVVARLKDPAFNAAGRTLGVVTFNAEQQTLIENLLDDARREDPSIEPHFSEDRLEAVFVKNLESVQGDERDIILFSVTYGPDISGKITMTFGPLNKEGGHRRLNVAITRARSEMLVMSSIRADQIDLSRTSARGARDLKHFLDFAERGTRALGEAVSAPGGDFESPFEAAVGRDLRERGWTVQPQIGVSAFRIDLGIVHPDHAGRYLAGVECDGATYHSSATARDRDKVREDVLNRLGWTLIRLWSTDFWIDRAGSIDRIDARLRQCLEDDRAVEQHETRIAAQVEPDSVPEEAEAQQAEPELFGPDEAFPVRPATIAASDTARPTYRCTEPGDIDIALDPERFYEPAYDAALSAVIDAVVTREAPLLDEVLVRRVARLHGFQRAGAQIRERVLTLADGRHLTAREPAGTFFWPADADPPTFDLARVPERPADRRLIDEISDHELAAFVRKHHGADDVPTAIARDLRITRLSAAARHRLERIVQHCAV